MKKYFYFPAVVALLLFGIWRSPLDAQSRPDPGAQFLPILQAVIAQQTALSDNQKLIEASLVRIQEDVRQARIFSARSSSGKSK